MTAWLANEYELLEAFREGRDIYSEFASTIFGRKITKADIAERFVGKTSILGLGFGTGPAKLQYTLALGTQGPAVFLPFPQCADIVATYRTKYRKIQELWRKLDDLIKVLIRGPDGIKFGPVVFNKGRIDMPNGLSLHYPDCWVEENGEKGYRVGDRRTNIYGGKLTENLASSLARIVIGNQMLQIRKHNRIVMMSHDELTALASRQRASSAVRRMLALLSVPPEWAPDLPLKAEGFHSKRYDK